MSRTPTVNWRKALDAAAGRTPQAAAEIPAAGSPLATRVYRGRTVKELLPKIKQELGSDAIIVDTREGLTGGVAGFFQHRCIELEATPGGERVDVYDEEEERVSPVAPAAPRQNLAADRQLGAAPFYSREPQRPGSDSVGERFAALARAGPPRPALERPPAPKHRAAEFRELAREDSPDSFASVLEDAQGLNDAPLPSRGATGHKRTPRGRTQASIQSKLLGFGISEQFAQELIDGAAAHVLPFAPRAGLLQAVQSTLAQRIPVAPPLPPRGAAIALVGPGGAGKTSCAAALLSAYRRSALLPANCATLNRGAERGELQMLLSPHVMRPTSIDASRAVRALSKARSEGLLVIDTPALSPGDRSGIRKLSALLSELESERVMVALPATLGATAAAQLLEALGPLGVSAMAITHADETDQIGVVVEAACRFSLAPEYTLDRARSGGWRLSRIDPTGLAAKLLQ